jgi:hypothetical protein
MTKYEAKLYIEMLEVAAQEGLADEEHVELGKKLSKEFDIPLDLNLV